jgi:hypothetical protein
LLRLDPDREHVGTGKRASVDAVGDRAFEPAGAGLGRQPSG